MIKKTIKKLLRYQHTYFPLNLKIYSFIFKYKFLHRVFYKYFLLCFDTDANYKKPNTEKFNKSYWLSRRALYWHLTHFYHNRFTHIFDKIYNNYPFLFKDKTVCDFMCGIGPYFKNKKVKLIFIEANKYCCDILKKNYPKSKIINAEWNIISKFEKEIDTLFVSSGCLIYLDEYEIDQFFMLTSKIKNFIFIHEGTDKDDFKLEYSGHNYWNFQSRFEKYNIHNKNSKIYFEKGNKIFNYFIYSSK